MGPGAFAITSRSKSGRAKRAFTSPPQWATRRSRGARDRSSSPKRRAVPGRDEGVGVGQEAAQARGHAPVGDARPGEAAAEAPLARRVEERAEERLSGEDEHPRALHMTLTSPWPGRRGVADEQEDDGRPRAGDDARDEEDRGEGEAVGDDADQEGRDDRADARRRCPTSRRPRRPRGSGRGRRAARGPWWTSPRRRRSPPRSRRAGPGIPRRTPPG